MATRAKAAVLVGPRKIEIEEFPLPETGDDDALLRVEACGVCGADVPPFLGEGLGEGGVLSINPPVILGHEITGRVERLGRRAAEKWGVSEGDRVIIERWIPCGHCDKCYAGDYRLCIRKVDGFPLFYGGSSAKLTPALWGGYADYVYLHPDSVVYKVSPDVAPEILPLFTPISNGISWTQISGGAGVGSRVIIQGPGQEGFGAVIGAKEAGASQIIVTGLARDERRLEIARQLGATHTLIADKDDVVTRVREITDGQMGDVVLDLTSGPSTKPVELAIEMAGDGGTVVLAATHEGHPIPNFVSDKIMQKTLTVRGVRGRYRKAVKAALKIIEAGKYPLEILCTHHFGVEDTELALKTAAREGDAHALHVCVMPGYSGH
jgi:threonine dehydrogenase-like Zn-dependent dehydrogenase